MPPELGLALWPAPWRALGGLMLEAAVGYPDALHRRWPHPVVWLGGAVSALERRWNAPARSERARRALGTLALIAVAGAAAAAGWALQAACGAASFGALLVLLPASLGLAQRSLYDHVAAVAGALDAGDLPRARAAVGRIVGRDVEALDAAGVAAAALESLAESFNDGVVAPAAWLAVGGLPGLFAYKAINTADSLIGHREPRWRAFGWAAARSDDLANLAPARLAGLLIAAAAGGRGLRVMLRDAPRHASPNAGWPEAAMAGALGRRLGGPAAYDGVATDRPTFGDGPAPAAGDLRRGLALYLRACALLWLVLAIGALAWPR
jgi:adenosylcobinamide-phosphate synthase